jgi:putative hydrolase of the HAD superfamily
MNGSDRPGYQAVTLDVHGTLILPDPSIGQLYAELGRRHGLDHESGRLQAAFVPAFRAVAARWDIPYGRDEADARRFWDAVIDGTFGGGPTPALRAALFEHFARGSTWRVLPGVREAVTLLRARGLPLYACSNFDGRVHRILDEIGLHLDHIFTSAEVGAAKPDPRMLLLAAERAGCRPQDLLHIGDHEREDGGACSACGATWFPVVQGEGIDCHALEAVLSPRA